MSSLKILIYFGDRNIEVEERDLVEELNENEYDQAKSSILIRSELYFHSPKLHSPTHIIIQRRLESD